MRKKVIGVSLCALLFALCFSVEAQPKKIARMGFLGGSSASAYSSFLEAFRQSLHDLGYDEGQNIAIDYRYGEGKRDRLPGLSADLAHLKVDVIVVSGALAISALKNATKTIPIVMTTVEDPVAQGFVASLARPGGNITGLTNLAPELSGKRLELLKESFPKISRVAVLWDPSTPGSVVTFKETQIVAPALGVQLQSVEVRSPNDFEGAFRLSNHRTRWCSHRAAKSAHQCSPATDSGTCGQQSATVDVHPDGICRSWWPHVLCAKLYRYLSSRCHLCRQNSQRH